MGGFFWSKSGFYFIFAHFWQKSQKTEKNRKKPVFFDKKRTWFLALPLSQDTKIWPKKWSKMGENGEKITHFCKYHPKPNPCNYVKKVKISAKNGCFLVCFLALWYFDSFSIKKMTISPLFHPFLTVFGGFSPIFDIIFGALCQIYLVYLWICLMKIIKK